MISSSFFFDLRATLAGERGDLRSGTYRLQLGMSYGSVLKTLTTPPKPAKVTNLTITEGRTRREINALLRSQHIRGSYVAATRHSPLLNPRHYGAPRHTSSLEGFLFPSTYQLREPISLGALVAESAEDLQVAVQARQRQLRAIEAPDALRRADHRVDDRGRDPDGA